jgi:transcriptional regulator with XRE-family HTH domain
MNTTSLYDEEMKDPEFAKLMAEESLILEVTEKIIELMQKEGITKAELANRLRKSKGFITQLLDGSRNFTVRTIADIFHALGYSLQVMELKYKYQQDQDSCDLIKVEFPKRGKYHIKQQTSDLMQVCPGNNVGMAA